MDIALLVTSFLAGVLTVLAPCILPLLPVVVGGSLYTNKNPYKPFIITASLVVSILIFTLILKATTALLGIPPYLWQIISGAIVIVLGFTFIWPKLWEGVGAKLNLRSSRLLSTAGKKQGIMGDILTGAALGPVFSSCSPTYAFILAGVLPSSLGAALLYLTAYSIGLGIVLLAVALLGQSLITRIDWATDPNGWLKKALGILFIFVGLFVLTGLDKQLQTYLVENGAFDAISEFERRLLK